MTPPAATEVAARAYGVTFRVQVDDPSLLPTLVARLPPGTRTGRTSVREAFCCSVETMLSAQGSAQACRVYLDDTLHSVEGDTTECLDEFESLIRFEVARRAPLWTFVHAGVVGWHGRAIVIPGKSYSGKSTLVHALVGAGATYYSDEYAVLDQRGLVYPFAQPLMQRTESGTRLRLSPHDLGATVGTCALPVGMVALTHHTPGAQWAPVTKTPGEGLLALLANSVRAQTAPARVMRALARVAEQATVLESPRAEAAETAATLLSRDAAWQTPRRSTT
jgi:hypothetical protein